MATNICDSILFCSDKYKTKTKTKQSNSFKSTSPVFIHSRIVIKAAKVARPKKKIAWSWAKDWFYFCNSDKAFNFCLSMFTQINFYIVFQFFRFWIYKLTVTVAVHINCVVHNPGSFKNLHSLVSMIWLALA